MFLSVGFAVLKQHNYIFFFWGSITNMSRAYVLWTEGWKNNVVLTGEVFSSSLWQDIPVPRMKDPRCVSIHSVIDPHSHTHKYTHTHARTGMHSCTHAHTHMPHFIRVKVVFSVGKGLLFLSDTLVWSPTSITKGNAH